MDEEQRLIDIEAAIATQEKMIDDLNLVVIEQGKTIDKLVKQNRMLVDALRESTVKPLSEETPPPHY